MKKIPALLLCFLALLLTSYMPQEKIDLSLKLKKGKTYYHSSVAKITINQKIQGKEIKTYMTMKGKMSFKVTGVTDSTFEMETAYKSISYSMRISDKLTEYSSDSKDTNDAVSRVLAKMINQPFNVTMFKDGKVSSVKNLEVLFTNLLNKYPNIPKSKKAEIMDQLRQSFGEKAFISSIESVTEIFPDKEVSLNDKWKISTEMESEGTLLKVETTYELAQITSEYAIIKGEAMVTPINKDTNSETNKMPVKLDLSGTVKSTIKVHYPGGWIIDSDVNQDLKGNAEIKDNPKVPGGMIMPMEMISEMKVEDK